MSAVLTSRSNERVVSLAGVCPLTLVESHAFLSNLWASNLDFGLVILMRELVIYSVLLYKLSLLSTLMRLCCSRSTEA